jgi:ribonuclease BN (tRNA processing enzyme)
MESSPLPAGTHIVRRLLHQGFNATIKSSMAEIIVIGSACGFPVPRHGHSSVLLSANDKLILVDAGEPCSRSMTEAGIRVDTIDAILLTHGHSDHTGGLPMLIQAMWILDRQKPLAIFLPNELSKPLQEWLSAVYLGAEFVPFELAFIPWEPKSVFDLHGLKVHPRETTHLESLVRKFGPGRFKAYSLLVESPEFRILFSGDLGSPIDLEQQLAVSVDLLISELTHFAPKELWKFLGDKRVRKLLLTHLGLDLYGKEESLLEEARTALPAVELVLVANDGLRLAV